MHIEEFSKLASEAISAEIAQLKLLSFEEVQQLPEARAADILVGNKEVQLTVFKQSGLAVLQDATLLTVQLSRFGLGGVTIYQAEEGLLFFAKAATRQATTAELNATRA